MNNFVKSVHDYFMNRKNTSSTGLDATESGILSQAERFLHCYPVCSLTSEDLAEAGFDTSDVTDRQLSCLADKLGDDYREQLYWTSLEVLAGELDIPRGDVAERMRDEYLDCGGADGGVRYARVLINYKDDDSGFENVFISIGNVSDDARLPFGVKQVFHSVDGIDDLCALCNRDNRYGFYISDFIGFS